MSTDPRPNLWRSRLMLRGLLVLLGGLALLAWGAARAIASARNPPAPAPWWHLLPTVLVTLTSLALAVHSFRVMMRRSRDLVRDPMLAAVVAQRAGVVALRPQDAFDAALKALGTVPGARIDPERTSVGLGCLSATTGQRPFSGPGERIEVQLVAVDDDHVAVFATSNQKYRGAGENRQQNDWNVLRLFAALPVEQPYDTTRPWQPPPSS